MKSEIVNIPNKRKKNNSLEHLKYMRYTYA